MITDGPVKVLTIDDEKNIRDGFKNYLEDYDYHVFTAADGKEGLEIFKREQPDIVLVDLRMPDIDGLDVLAEVKKTAPDIPVIVISGTGIMADAVQALRLGAWDFLLKPVADLSVLLHTVEKGVERRRLLLENRAHQYHLEREVTRRTQELERANWELQQINTRLRNIVETTKNISQLSRFDRFGSWLLEEFGRHMTASGGSLYLLETNGLKLIHTLDPGHAPQFIPFPLRRDSFLNRTINEGKPLLLKGEKDIDDFVGSGWPGYKNDSFLIFPLPDEDGKIVGILSLHSKTAPPFLEQDREIGSILASYSSEALRAVRAGEALKESEENLAITLDSIGDGVIAADAAGRITRMNPVAQTLTGWSVQEAVGLSLTQVFHIVQPTDKKPAPNPMQKMMREGNQPTSAETVILIHRTGGECYIAMNGSPIRNRPGAIVGMVLVFRDISEHLKLEEQLRQSGKMDAIGQLSGGIAHDFNNMLAGILGAADILAIKLKENKKLLKYAAMIQDTGTRAAQLTQKLLDFSRKTAATCCPVDMHKLIEEAVRILERSTDKRIEIVTDFCARHSIVVGDAAQLENAVLNLGVNARDAMPNGGMLLISTVTRNLNQHQCAAADIGCLPGTYVEVSVTDTGTGIKPDVLTHMFEPFFTTKPAGKGTGLGLASVYSSVRNHNGDIIVSSQPGKGTMFKLYLPVDESSRTIDPVAQEEQIIYGSGCILVVDDEEVIRNVSETVLCDLGYNVLLCADGRAAVALYETEHPRIDLVLLDMVMPKKNGKDTFLAMQKINPHVKVLFTTGADAKEMAAPEGSGFLQKPFRRVELSRKVHKLLEEKK